MNKVTISHSWPKPPFLVKAQMSDVVAVIFSVQPDNTLVGNFLCGTDGSPRNTTCWLEPDHFDLIDCPELTDRPVHASRLGIGGCGQIVSGEGGIIMRIMNPDGCEEPFFVRISTGDTFYCAEHDALLVRRLTPGTEIKIEVTGDE